MINIFGYLKINESIPERTKYFHDCIRSYEFLKNDSIFVVALQEPSDELYSATDKLLSTLGFKYELLRVRMSHVSYGVMYKYLLECYANKNWPVLNFMEDQFMVMDDKDRLSLLLFDMKVFCVDILKCTFNQIENNSASFITNKMLLEYGVCYINTSINFIQYKKFYKSRFYIGVNFITTYDFAVRFWGRPINSKRPHDYEVFDFDKEFIHLCMIPNFEIQCAIDDDHGAENSCLLKRKDVEKFWSIHNLK